MDNIFKLHLNKLEKNVLFGGEMAKKAKKLSDAIVKESKRVYMDDPMSCINFEFYLVDIEDQLDSWRSSIDEAEKALNSLLTICDHIKKGKEDEFKCR